MGNRVLPITPTPGIPDEFIQKINSRFRSLSEGASDTGTANGVGAAGDDRAVQYKSAGRFAGSPNFIYDSTGQIVTITAQINQAGLHVVGGYVQADLGYGFTGRTSDPPLSGPHQALLYYYDKDDTQQIMVSYNGGPYSALGSGGGSGSPGGVNQSIQFQVAGVFAGSTNLLWDNVGKVMTTNGSQVLGKITTEPALSATDTAKYYFNGTQIMVSYSGAAYIPIGGSGSQTPWLSNIDGNKFNLSNVQDISVNDGVTISAAPNTQILSPSGFLLFKNSLSRWNMVQDGAEGGGNTGSDLYFYRYNDGGGFLDVAMVMRRKDGFIGIGGVLNPSAPLHVKGAANTAVIECDTGYVQSDEGFLTLNTADTAVNAQNGGIYGQRHIALNSYVALGIVAPYPTPTDKQGKFYYDAITKQWMMTEGTAGPYPVRAQGVAGTDTQIQFNGPQGVGGSFTAVSSLTYDSGNQLLKTVNIEATNRILSDGSYSVGTLTGTVPVASGGYAKWYYDGDVMKLSLNTSPFFTWSAAGTNEDIQFRDADGGFGGTDNFIYDKLAQCVTITGKGNLQGLIVKGAYVDSAAGFYSANTSDTTINILNGGSSAQRQIAINSFVGLGVVSPYPSPAATQGKFYFDAITKRWMMTEDTAGPFFVRSGGVAGADTQLQYNKANAFAADGNLVWDYTAQALKVTGKSTSYSIYAITGYIQSDAGFNTANTSYQAIQAPSGGLYAAGLGIVSTTSPNHGGYIDIPPLLGSITFPAPLVNASFGSNDALLWTAAANGTTMPISSTYALCCNIAIDSAGGFRTLNNAYNSFNSPNGGIQVGKGVAADQGLYLLAHGVATELNNPPGTYGGFAYKGAGVYWYWTGSGWTTANLGATGANVAGVDMQIQYNRAANFGADSNFAWDYTNQTLLLTGKSGTAGIAVNNAYIQTAGGLLVSSNTSYNSIQTPGGIVSLTRLSVYPNFTPDLGAGLGAVGHFVSGNGTVAVLIDAYDTSGNNSFPLALPGIVGRRAVGPYGGPYSNVPNGTVLFAFGGRGSTTNGFTTTNAATASFQTSENWTPSANGADIVFATTKNGGISRVNYLFVRNDGLIEALGRSGLAGMVLTNGYFQSNDSGFFCNGSFVSVFNAPNGGASLGMAVYLNTRGSAPPNPLTGYGGIAYNTGSTYWYWNGSSWQTVNFAATGGSIPPNVSANSFISTMGTGITANAFGLQSALFAVDGNGNLTCQKIIVNGFTCVSGSSVWLGGVQGNDHVYGLDFGIMTSTPGVGKATGAGSTTSANVTGIPTGPGSSQPAFTVACSDGYNRPVRGGLICSQ